MLDFSWHTLQEQQPRRNSDVLVQYVDGYGNFCDYDAVTHTPISNGTYCLQHHGTVLNYSKVKRWLDIDSIPYELWKSFDGSFLKPQKHTPVEGEFVLAEIYRDAKLRTDETAYIVLLRKQLSCAKFTGVGFVRYDLYHADERVIRWVALKDLE